MNTDPSSLTTRSLSGQFLIAMPGMGDPRFDKSLIFLCDHNDEGAMGLIVNKPIIETDFAEICDFLDIDCPQERDVPVLYGGPVDTQAFLAMGYAGWGAGQLEQELKQNAWLVGTCDHDLIFGEDHDVKWEMALMQAGVDPRLLMPSVGHA
ncbi:MAG: hypothetical protein EBW60_12105 [Rhodobacteraceae bacterium]|nr:hypothetical protein [Paracoccaceae bacterium]